MPHVILHLILVHTFEKDVYFFIFQVRLKSFRNPEKKKWIRFEIVVAMLTSFLLHLPYYFQEEITPSICSESARDSSEAFLTAILIMGFAMGLFLF